MKFDKVLSKWSYKNITSRGVWIVDTTPFLTDAMTAKLTDSRLEALTDAETERVNAALLPPHDETILVSKFNTSISRRLIHCLISPNWLNDEIVNFSMCMLQERDDQLCTTNKNRRSSHYFSSFFISKLFLSGNYEYENVKRWTKKVNLFKKDRVYCPVNINNTHWTMLVMFIQQKKIQYFDSLGGPGDIYLKGALRYLGDEAEKLRLKEFKKEDWQLVSSQQGTPQQENGFDCGVFSIMFADFLTDFLPLTFQQENIVLFRKKICANVLRGSLKYELVTTESSLSGTCSDSAMLISSTEDIKRSDTPTCILTDSAKNCENDRALALSSSRSKRVEPDTVSSAQGQAPSKKVRGRPRRGSFDVTTVPPPPLPQKMKKLAGNTFWLPTYVDDDGTFC